jgi:acetyl esterase/lipase
MFKNEKYACFAVDCSTNLYTSGQQLPMPIREVKAALRFLRASYGEDGWIDTTFIAVVGFNLGGYVASMMGVTRNIDSYTIGSETWDFESSDFAAYSSSVDAVIDIAGYAEWKDADGCVSSSYDSDAAILGCSYANCPDKWELANLNAYVTPDAAPTLIIHGETDPVIPICRNEKFFATLQTAGVDCEFHTHAGGHIFSSLSSDLREKAVDFIKRIRAAKQAQAIESPSLQGRSGEASKFIQNGQLLILRGDKTFNAIGTQVK